MCVPSQFVCVESLATSITDMFPNVLRRSGRREILVLVIAVVCFLLGLPLITEVGERERGSGGREIYRGWESEKKRDGGRERDGC